MKVGDPVVHTGFNTRGVVASKPREGAARIRVQLDGNTAPCYYSATEIAPFDPSNPPPPSTNNYHSRPRAPRVPDMEPPIPDAKEPSLQSLIDLRNRVRADLDALDEQLMFCRLQRAFVGLADKFQRPVVEATEKFVKAISTPPAAPPRLPIKTDLEKVRSDTQQALKAAERLFSRGAL